MKQISNFANRLREAATEQGCSLTELADRVGLSRQTISAYATGMRQPKPPTLAALAAALEVSPDWLSGYNVDKRRSPAPGLRSPRITDDVVTFPIIGEVAAGYDHPALEDWSGDTVDIPRHYLHGRRSDDYFVLRVIGDSMYPLYMDGDRVLVLRQSTLRRSGDIGVILYDGDQATLKKVEYVPGEDWLKLIPINPSYPPRTITGSDLEQCRVLGVPRLLIRESL